MDDQILDEQTREEFPINLGQPQPAWKKFFTNPRIMIPLIVALVLAVGIAWYFLSRTGASNTPTSNSVLLFVKGPEQLTSGNEGEYHIIYRNGENADLVSVSLEVLYPSGFTFKSATPSPVSSSGQKFNLNLVRPGQDGEVVIRGKLSGSTNEDKQINAKLHYSLSNFNSEFVVEQSMHTTVLPPNLTMDISGPVNVVNGQDTTLVVNFTNVTSQDFSNLGLQLTYPDGFNFTSSNPKTYSGQNYWKLDKLSSNTSGSISIVGSFTGDSSQDKLVTASLGQIINNTFAPQIHATATFIIIPSSLSLSLSAQPSSYVNLGDTINYKLKYGNRGTIGLSNLVITVNLDSPVLDFSRLSNPNAIVTNRLITWKAATLPGLSGLSPNEQGEISFSVPVKQILTSNLKSQSVTALATIAANEMPTPTRAADLTLKLISKLDLDVSGNFVSGTVPMQVGKPTLFNLTFLLTNLSNDLSDVQVVASLPLSASAWKNVIVPDSEKDRLNYDPGSGKITWRIGALPAFTGKFLPALTVSFQLEVIPTESDRGKPMNLLSNIQAYGSDTFVNQTIQTQVINSVSTSGLDDNVLDAKGTTVE